jgi:hypothetical protein
MILEVSGSLVEIIGVLLGRRGRKWSSDVRNGTNNRREKPTLRAGGGNDLRYLWAEIRISKHLNRCEPAVQRWACSAQGPALPS